jgi:arsenite oxidase large subunit
MVTDAVREGVLFGYFLQPGSPVNSLVHRVPDPITNRYRFKLGKGRLEKIGESDYRKEFDRFTFAPRTIA